MAVFLTPVRVASKGGFPVKTYNKYLSAAPLHLYQQCCFCHLKSCVSAIKPYWALRWEVPRRTPSPTSLSIYVPVFQMIEEPWKLSFGPSYRLVLQMTTPNNDAPIHSSVIPAPSAVVQLGTWGGTSQRNSSSRRAYPWIPWSSQRQPWTQHLACSSLFQLP